MPSAQAAVAARCAAAWRSRPSRSVAARAYEARTTPHMFVVGPDGTLRYMGGIDSIRSARAEDVERAEPWLREAMRAVAAGRPVERASTQPYGCAVKYADPAA